MKKRLNLQLAEEDVVEIKIFAAEEKTTPAKAIIKAVRYYKTNKMILRSQLEKVGLDPDKLHKELKKLVRADHVARIPEGS